MKHLTRIGSSMVLALHGLIHQMGFIVYLRFGEIEGLPYKTSLLNGRLDVGEGGIALFGSLWAAAGILFLGSGEVWLVRKRLPRKLLLAAALFSLALTGLDYSSAYAGVAINLIILVLVMIKPLWPGEESHLIESV